MSIQPADRALGEKLVDARYAALVLNLPLHWLVQKQQRKRRGIPHYRVGKLLRFKLGELRGWMETEHANASESKDDVDA